MASREVARAENAFNTTNMRYYLACERYFSGVGPPAHIVEAAREMVMCCTRLLELTGEPLYAELKYSWEEMVERRRQLPPRWRPPD